MTKTKKRPVIVTTSYRGAYFGYLEKHTGQECILTRARMSIRWGTTNGVDQLAATGPTDKSKIGARAPRIWLCGLTSVVDCTLKATEAWEAVNDS